MMQRDVLSAGVEVLQGMHALTRVLVLYEVNNTAVGRVITAMHEALEGFFAEGATELKLLLLSEEFFVNGRLLKVDAQLYERGRELAAALSRFDIGELRFERGCSREELERFAADLGACMRGGARTLGQYPGIQVGAGSRGRSAAAFRFEPDRLAIWLYASLLDVADQLYARAEAQEPPSLRPLRRVLQLIIDNMRQHGGIYQALTAVRDPGAAPSHAQLRAAISVDVVGFGQYVGLSSNDRMTLALAGLLGGIVQGRDPEAALQPLLRYGGLGEAAMPLVLTLFDARAVQTGHPAGIPGQMLAVVEAYHDLVSGRQPPVPAPLALGALVKGEVPGREPAVARLFVQYKGRFPLGSLVRLSEGSPGLVLSQGDDELGKVQPRIGLLPTPDRLEGRLDLRERTDLRIVEALTPEQAGVRLAEL